MANPVVSVFRRLKTTHPVFKSYGSYEVIGQGPSTEVDDMGYAVPGAEVVLATHPGNFRTLTADERMAAAQMQEEITGIVSLPHDAEVDGTMRLRDARTGVEYEVRGVVRGEPELMVSLNVRVRRV